MQPEVHAIRPFIGAEDFNTCRRFYTAVGFTEKIISPTMCLFSIDNFSFYLQDAYVKDWVDNSMIFLEIKKLDDFRSHLASLGLPSIFKNVKLSKIVDNDWGREFFLHDPSGILWHIGSFASVTI